MIAVESREPATERNRGLFLGRPQKTPSRRAGNSVATKILIWTCSRIPWYTAVRQAHERNQNQTFPPLAGSGKCKVASAARPPRDRRSCTASSPGRVLRISAEFRTPHLERRTSHEFLTPSGHSSAFPDTPRDRLHVTPTTWGSREKLSESRSPVHVRTD
jgi:hypothetical protein